MGLSIFEYEECDHLKIRCNNISQDNLLRTGIESIKQSEN